MKYLMLVLALGACYGLYSYGTEAMASFEHMRAKVSAVAGKSPSPGTGPIIIPGEADPVVAAQPSGNLPPAPVESFKNRLASSQRAAVQKYPTLGQANSEMNSRFLFRYKKLVADKSARLQDPAWPLSLADECAAAVAESKVKSKPVTASNRKGTLAVATPTAQ